MMLSRSGSQIVAPIFVLIAGVIIIAWGMRSPKYVGVPQDAPTLVAPRELSLFTLGYSAIISDALWLRIIQDFDFCESRPAGVNDPSLFKCANGWVYKMLDATTEVDPRFKQPHISGALMLTVVVNDIEGASKLFDKAVARFPDDWNILYAAAYQAMIEEKNLTKASDLLDRAGRNGAPDWTRSLAARLQQKSGQLDLAKSILENAVATASDKRSAELFERRLKEVNEEIAKQKVKDAASGALEPVTK